MFPAAPDGAAELFVEFVFEPSSGMEEYLQANREEPACTKEKYFFYDEWYV